MSTYTPTSIEEREERIAECRAEIQNIAAEYDGQKFDEHARDRWNDLNTEIEEHQDAIREMRTRKERLRALAGNPANLEQGSRGDFGQPGNLVTGELSPFSSSDESLPSLMPTRDELQRLHAAVRVGTNARLESRATVTTSESGADNLATELPTRPRRERRIAVAAGLGRENVAGVTSVEFPVFGSGDADIPGSETATKQEYDNVSADSATPSVIAIWTRTTRQNLLTMRNFEGKLRSVLAAKVARREDELLVDTVLANDDIQLLNQSVSADAVLEAAAMVADSDVASNPNLVAINPSDAPTLLGADVGSGGTASPPFAEFLPTIHGMSVYITNHVDEGEAIVGAWNMASHLVVGISPTFLVDSLSRVTTNEITLLLEEAVALAIDEPDGFVHVAST
ncbi:phage major capsid protein [Phytoactinopolyspora endophytica]|uniref:phage major capsid protein n=1 Tax=Phytoactinopolyspora endophytica TaxID=1642495 RepID=UPI00101D852B|nr:phage major capsid protein [Phytoactinopolyspora endophytica]